MSLEQHSIDKDKLWNVVDRIGTKIALSNDEAKLQQLLDVYLPKLLSLLSIQDERLRNKIVEILSQVNKLARIHETVQLPFASILELYVTSNCSASSSPFLKHFSSLYVEMSFSRLSSQQKALAVPSLALHLKRVLEENNQLDKSSQGKSIEDILLRYFLLSLRHFTFPQHASSESLAELRHQQLEIKQKIFQLSDEEVERENELITETTNIRAFYSESIAKSQTEESEKEEKIPIPPCQQKVTNIPEHIRVILNFLKDVLLFRANFSFINPVDIPNGLSIQSICRITGNSKIKPSYEEVRNWKIAALNFLLSGIFEDITILPHLLIGSCDAYEGIRDMCENVLKRIADISYFEDNHLIEQLFTLYLGVPKQNRSGVADDLKLKILQYLSRSITSANMFPQAKDVVFHCLFSEYSSQKLKAAGMEFYIWILRHAKNDIMEPHAEQFLTKILQSLGSLQTTTGYSVNEKMQIAISKENLYIALGETAKKFPNIVQNKLHLVQLYFHALETEEPQIRIYIQQGLGSLIQAFKDNSQVGQYFEQIILDIAQNSDASNHAVFSALQTTNRLFSFDHIPSRIACLIRSADSMIQVREEALRGVDLESFRKFKQFEDASNSKKEVFPNFVPFLEQFRKIPNHHLSSDILVSVLQFCRNCIQANSYCDHDPKSDMDSKIQYLKQYVNYLSNCSIKTNELTTNVIDEYIELIKCGLDKQIQPSSLIYECACSLIQLLQGDLELCNKINDSLFEPLNRLLLLGDDFSREKMSLLMALLFPTMDNNRKQEFVAYLRSMIDPTGINSSESRMFASIYTLGYICAVETLQVKSNVKREPHFLSLEGIIKEITLLMENTKHSVQIAVFGALAALGRCGTLQSIFSEEILGEDEIDRKKRRRITKKTLLLEIVQKLKQENCSEKVMEKIIYCLSMIGLGEQSDMNCIEQILDAFFSLATNKATELQFSIGEALALISGGVEHCHENIFSQDDIHVLTKVYDNSMKDQVPKLAKFRDELMRLSLKKIIKDGVLHPKSIVRQSSSIWILAIVRYCTFSPFLKKSLHEIQQALSILLSDSNDITQEVAAKAMAYVYELGDSESKKLLVNNLLETLSGKKKNKDIKISEDSTMLIFPEDMKQGSLNSTPTTYRELASVATDIGKPDMIYKLLQLSNTNTVWNTKKGAAFSTFSIAANLKKEDTGDLKEILPKIVPKLFRYMFDPNVMISKSMNQLWNALVDNSNEVINKNLKSIMIELLNGINSEMWRVREACCNAICEIYSGRTFKEMEPFIEETFYKVFRVADDEKESSRKAAIVALKKIGQFSVKICNIMYTGENDIKRALEIVMRIYLEKGIHFPVKEIVYFSLENLHKICEVCGHHIRPYITPLIGNLIEHISVLEPSIFNYLQMNAQNYKISTEDLETLRLNTNRSGPIHDIITACEKHVNQQVAETLIPRLIEISARGVGLTTRIATSRCIENLAKFHPKSVKPFSAKLLKSLMQSIEISKSPSERNNFASTLSSVMKISKVTSARKTIEDILNLYLTSNEANSANTSSEQWSEKRYICGVILQHICKNVVAIVKRMYEQILPIAFIARFDPMEKVGKVWESVWEDSIPSTSKDTISLYLNPISELCFKILDGSSWVLKKQGGCGLLEISSEIGIQIPLDVKNKMIVNMISSMKSKTWEGKDVLVCALGEICYCYQKMHDSIGNLKIEREIITRGAETVLKECKKIRTLSEYKVACFKSLSRLLSSPSIQEDLISGAFYCQIIELMDEEFSTNCTVENRNLAKLDEQLKVELFSILSRSFPSESLLNNVEEKLNYVQQWLKLIIDRLKGDQPSAEMIAMMNAIRSFLHQYLSHNFLQNFKQQLLPLMKEFCELLSPYILDNSKYTIQVRQASKNALEQILKLLKGDKISGTVSEKNHDLSFGGLVEYCEQVLHKSKL